MLRSWRQWTAGLALGALFIMVCGEVPLRADGTGARSFPDSDSFQFREEFLSRGAYKFFNDTEDILRSGNFELAWGRYLFLASQTRSQSIYAGLNAATNQRLQFLREQMRLGEVPLRVAKPLKRRVRRVSQAKPAPAEKKAGPEASPEGQKPSGPQGGSAGKPGEIIIPPTGTPDQKPAPSVPETKPSAPEVKPDTSEPAEAPPPPPPPPSAWEKIKRRLKFW